MTSQIFLNERRAFQFYHVITKLRIDEIAFSDVITVPGIPSYLEPMMSFDYLEQTPISLVLSPNFTSHIKLIRLNSLIMRSEI